MKLFPEGFFSPTYVLLGNRPPQNRNDLKLQFIIIFHNFMCVYWAQSGSCYLRHPMKLWSDGWYSHQKTLLDRCRRWRPHIELLWAWIDSWEVWQKYLYRSHTCVLSSQSITVVLERECPKSKYYRRKVTRLHTWASKFPKLTSMFHWSTKSQSPAQACKRTRTEPIPCNGKNINIC